MDVDIQTVLADLMFLRRSAPERTKVFRRLTHNEHLCPMLQRQLETATRGFGKYRPIIVYDTQGSRDDGGDIILNCAERDDQTGEERVWLVAFQVKSFPELSNKGVVANIKAQRDDAFRKIHGLQQYYILLCTDEKHHKDRIRFIAAEFRSADRTVVVEPGFSYHFLHMPELRVSAFLKRLLESGDLVYRMALEDTEPFSPAQVAIASFLIVHAIADPDVVASVDDLQNNGAVRNIYQWIPDVEYDYDDEVWDALREQGEAGGYMDDDAAGEVEWESPELVLLDRSFEERLSDDLEVMDGGLIDVHGDSGQIHIHPSRLSGLTALITDAMARYAYKAEHIPQYVLEILGVPSDG